MKLPLTLPLMKSRCSFRNLLLATTCLAALAGAQASATTTNFNGTFKTDDQVNLYTIVVGQNSNVTFQTTSYGGGTLGGVTVKAGGFVPILTLFDSTGMFLFTDGGDADMLCGHVGGRGDGSVQRCGNFLDAEGGHLHAGADGVRQLCQRQPELGLL